MKILLVGPSKSGKTALSTYLAGLSDSIVPAAAPAPTVGVRVLELERQGVGVELWDVSGDQAYETTWPAVQQGADGVVLIYSPEVAGQSKEVELWWEWFVVRTGLDADRVACFALRSTGAGGSVVAPSALGGLASEAFLVTADGGEGVRRAFDRFVARLNAMR